MWSASAVAAVATSGSERGTGHDTRAKCRVLSYLPASSLHPTSLRSYLFQGAEPGPPYITGDHLVENAGGCGGAGQQGGTGAAGFAWDMVLACAGVLEQPPLAWLVSGICTL